MFARSILLLALFPVGAVTGQAITAIDEPAIIEGRVELSPASADAAARLMAEEEFRWEFERRGRDVVDLASPIWLPGVVGDLILDRWLRSAPLERAFDIVDSEREQRDHDGYSSYRTRLWIAADVPQIDRAMRDLRAEVRTGSRRFAVFAGGTAGLWAFLALLYGWLDRLTRGYMPWRLRLICAGMGVAAPGIALFFV